MVGRGPWRCGSGFREQPCWNRLAAARLGSTRAFGSTRSVRGARTVGRRDLSGSRSRGLRRRGPRSRLGNHANDFAHVLLDAVHERLEAAVAALHPFQLSFPFAGHGRTLDDGMHYFDQPDAFVGCLQHFPVAADVLAPQQRLDDRRARRRRAQAAVFHRVGQLFFFERLAGGFHRGQQRGFGEAPGRARLLGQCFGVEHLHAEPALETRRQVLPAGGRRLGGACFRFAPRAFLFFLLVFRLPLGGASRPHPVENLPAFLLDHRSRTEVAVDQRLGSLLARSRRDGRNHGRDRPEVVLVPGAQQAAADQVVDVRLGRTGRQGRAAGAGGNDGVMIGDLGVVDETRPQRPRSGAGREQIAVGRGDRVDDLAQPRRHVAREVAAVGARVGD